MRHVDQATLPAEAETEITVTVLYFARLKEALGTGREQLQLPRSIRTVSALRDHLRARGAAWEAELAPAKPVRIAVNQDIATAATAIKAGDEIAFFPPVTGG